MMLRSLGPAIEHLKPHLSPAIFKAGQVVKPQGAPVERVYFPTHGLISSRAVLQSGHEIECALVGRTGALGLVAALGYEHGAAQFVCLTDGQAWTIGLPQLTSLVRRHPALERSLNHHIVAQLGYATLVGVCNAMHTAEQRLARWVCTAVELLGQPEVRIPQEELASTLGLQRTAVNPALQKLKAEGVIDVARGRLVVHDVERLSRRTCECLPSLRCALFLDEEFLKTASAIAAQ